MANNKIQFKRTSTSGLLPNTTNSANASFISAGEFAVNLTDKKVIASDGSLTFEVGANVTTLNVTNAITVNGTVTFANSTANTLNIYANGQILAPAFTGNVTGTASNSSALSSVTLATIQSQITGNAATAFSNAIANSAADATSKAATAYTNAIAIAANATNLTSGTVAAARLGSGTANSSTILYGNNVWAAAPGSSSTATMNTYTFTVASNTTVFTGLDDTSNTLVYTSGLESVFINGSRQIASVDYITTNTTVLTLTSNAIAGDIVQITTLNASITSGGGGGGTPGGSNTQIQFNDSGAFGGSAGFTFDKTTNNVTIANSLIMNTQSISITSGANTLTINPFNMFSGVGNSFSIAANNNNFTSIFIAANGNVGIQNNTPGAILTVGSNTMVLGSSSKTANGYAWLPNGILMQWGTVSSSTTVGDVTFPLTFPTAIIGVTVTPATTYILNGYPNVIAQTTAGCNVRTGSTTSRAMFYQALGY